jgi:hypothetical protein
LQSGEVGRTADSRRHLSGGCRTRARFLVVICSGEVVGRRMEHSGQKLSFCFVPVKSSERGDSRLTARGRRTPARITRCLYVYNRVCQIEFLYDSSRTRVVLGCKVDSVTCVAAWGFCLPPTSIRFEQAGLGQTPSRYRDGRRVQNMLVLSDGPNEKAKTNETDGTDRTTETLAPLLLGIDYIWMNK